MLQGATGRIAEAVEEVPVDVALDGILRLHDRERAGTMCAVENGAESLLPFAGLASRVADPNGRLDEALGVERQHRFEPCARLQRRLSENDVGAASECAIDEAYIMCGEQ